MESHRQDFFKFPLDPFQEEACQAIDAGENVIVCAPTGAGKTAVAEWAMKAALMKQQRCLYTTPLKALSNQKFFDLCELFGEDRVGLSTGDVSVRSQTDLVVMTTEVYRNMLYGTGPTEGDCPTLSRVASVILDECHYMNDTSRGTVWEESIVYSPKNVQIVGLSATVANAEEMRDWLEAIHGPTRLVVTDFRPVPLRYLYFRKGEMLDIFDRKNKKHPESINPKMFRFKDERAPRRRGGRPLGTMLCDARKMIEKMAGKDMLPAIYFMFSRKGCEGLLEDCRGAVSLSDEEREALDAGVLAKAKQHPEILEHPHLDSLRRGMAVHHAGILPVWKSLVEGLFAQGLLKVVFATETLAAGINMPARTTIISALSKFTGEGLRPLTGSEMLQMAGRAGRRGMDKAGNVVIGAHPKEPVEMVIGLAKAKPEPLESHFQPSYGMVLNLLQRRPILEVKELLDRSFGQFLHKRFQAGQGLSSSDSGREIVPPCPDEPGDREAYLAVSGRRRTLRGMLKDYNSGGSQKRKEIRAAKSEIEQELGEVNHLRKLSPCHGCSKYEACGRLYENKKQGESEKPSYWEEFTNLVSVLTESALLKDDRPTEIGQMMSQLRATNIFAIGESLLGPVTEAAPTLKPSQFAAVCCLLVSEPVRKDPRFEPPAVSPETRPLLHKILYLCEDIEEQQLDHGVERSVPCEMHYCGVAEIWGSGFSWEATKEISRMSGGDLFRVLRRTYDLCRQVANWRGGPEVLTLLARETTKVLMREALADNVAFFEAKEEEESEIPEDLEEAKLPNLAPLRKTRGTERDSSRTKRPPFGRNKRPIDSKDSPGRRRKMKRRTPRK